MNTPKIAKSNLFNRIVAAIKQPDSIGIAYYRLVPTQHGTADYLAALAQVEKKAAALKIAVERLEAIELSMTYEPTGTVNRSPLPQDQE